MNCFMCGRELGDDMRCKKCIKKNAFKGGGY